MIDDNIPERLDLRYQAPDRQEEKTVAPQTPQAEVGPSSLYGRVGDNITFHTQGAAKAGYFDQLWHWAWKDLGVAFLGFFRVFLPWRNK